ncbi:MAG: hypothetical protein C5B47_04220 [Verrucomicrobia bacterium]|nr:MAG: hypothetical protein C5B47_04220 [Verrucomicrobiota bacterium]
MSPKNCGRTFAQLICRELFKITILGTVAMEASNLRDTSDRQILLVVDPDTDFLAWSKHQLETPETQVLLETDSESAYKTFCLRKPDLIFSEVHLQPFSGLELLIRLRKLTPDATVILTSAFAANQNVIEAMKLGAFDFVRKEQLPFNFKIVVDAALKATAELRAASAFPPQLTLEQYQDNMVGKSDALQQVFKMIGKVAASDVPVMITGESGSGKELVARALHHYSYRNHRSFLAINCAAVPENLLESELFGHERGAFTGATSQRIGRFEQCEGGTLFLDGIGEMPLAVQGKLLRVLQEKEFSRVGSNQVLKADVRILAATNQNLKEAILRKTFREDLFYRLNVICIQLPPLRARTEDIRLLAEYFLQKIAQQKHRPLLKLSEEAVKVLEAYSWPGNVRELQNTIQRASLLATANVLLPKDIPLGLVKEDVEVDENAIQRAVETLFALAIKGSEVPLLPWLQKELVKRAIKYTAEDQIQAAKLVGITPLALRKQLERNTGNG